MNAPSTEVRTGRDWPEILATVLLSVAAVATAWSSYQAARWNGEQAKIPSPNNGVRVEAARAQGLAEAQTEIDVSTFIQWVDATVHEDTELADFYEERFREEFKPAFTAWVADATMPAIRTRTNAKSVARALRYFFANFVS